ncbi:MAG TPA: FmdB family zinc ribbon protein [Dehalococcoidia bacterium]|nr:FmdB family zinc ribbon protein [Dehalococcoidia bacterium]
MPIYEYRCTTCSRLHSLFFRSMAVTAAPLCPACGSEQMERLISRVALLKPEAQRISEFDADRALADVDWRDKGSFARWSRRMSQELGEDMGGRFTSLAEKMEAGQDASERIDPGVTLRYELDKRRREAEADNSGSEAAPSSE